MDTAAPARTRTIRLLLVAASAAVVLGCVNTVQSPSASAPRPSAANTSSSSPTLRIVATPAAPGTATPESTPIPDDVLLRNLPDAPASQWTALRWVPIPAAGIPTLSGPINNPSGSLHDLVTVGAWRGGYVEMVWDPWHYALVPWASADGVTWQKGNDMDLSPWGQHAKSHVAVDPDNGPLCDFNGTFTAGPSSLMLRGSMYCEGGCGTPSYETGTATWITSDGLTWKVIQPEKRMGVPGAAISGGASGYVGSTSIKGTLTAWTSLDGISWRRLALPSEALASTSTADAPVSFGNGFEMDGLVTVQAGTPDPTPGGCAGCCAIIPPDNPTPPVYEPAAWWSPDGSTWTKATLPGVVRGTRVSMSMWRLGDGMLMAEEQVSDAPELVSDTWVSTDGRTWVRTDRRSMYVENGNGLFCDIEGDGTAEIYTFTRVDADGVWHAVPMTGVAPTPYVWLMGIGPRGMLVTTDGTQMWMGVPSAE